MGGLIKGFAEGGPIPWGWEGTPKGERERLEWQEAGKAAIAARVARDEATSSGFRSDDAVKLDRANDYAARYMGTTIGERKVTRSRGAIPIYRTQPR